ncbi:S41A family C-terminal processing peptidase-1 [Alkalispirillum mobile]|uniref:S41A family C-terminal processing peptidase-1 n=1 Tax=Alkalispirillum mobile TaxID=85925 RepID=A0A498CE10_9GAMM|nr:carboxy terminal-processing peptidase [Alkalispirillum mobile]RLK50531.1 S41A family C-terminal processing peptidase-1 [Alkalispirillum mobile]
MKSQLMRPTLIVAGLLLALVLVVSGNDGPGRPGPAVANADLAADSDQRETASVIADLLTRYHYRGQGLDSALSDRVFDAWLDQLDRERFYLLQEDIEEFEEHRVELHEQLRHGDLSVPYALFERYRERVAERTEYALELLEDGLDFDTDLRFEQDRSEADWAESREELDRIWLKRVTHDALTQKLAGRDHEQVIETLSQRYERIRRTTEQDTSEDVFQRYMDAWAHAFDPHSSYLSPRRSEDFDINMSLSLEGIGAMLQSEHDFVTIVELVAGGPASQSDELSPGDRIIGVADGEDGEMEDVVGWRLSDVVDLIRGPRGSIVRLQVLPEAGASDTSPREVVLERNEIKLEDQAASSQVIEVPGDNSEKDRIGIITIPAFYMDFEAAEAGDPNYRSTTRDVRRLIEELQEDGIDGLVIDLRGNSGGSLREAASLSGLFMGGGPIVQVRRSGGDLEVLRGGDEANSAPVYDGPLGVMVDGFSASASEILAGAIQDYGRGVVMGKDTFGKGTVQTMINLDRFGLGNGEDGAGRLKLTVAKFYRVTGDSTQKKGVQPDIELPSPVDASEFGERGIDNALPWNSIEATDYRADSSLAEHIPSLRSRYELRSEDDPGFQALLREYDHLRERRKQTDVSLNEQTRQQERDEVEKVRLELHNERRKAAGLEPLEADDDIDEDELPDVLLEAAAAVIADLKRLQTAYTAQR